MTEIFSSRFQPGSRGDEIKWHADELAVFTATEGKRHRVTVATGQYVAHAGAPAQRCLEVTFDDEGGLLRCVRAVQLSWMDMLADHDAGRQFISENYAA